MRVAIIEDNKDYKNQLENLLKQEDISVDFFESSTDFGRTNLNQYDVIISDQSLEPISGRQLLNTISNKTDAELFLMNDRFDDIDSYNSNIKGLINKNNPQDIIDKLKYACAKIRIQKLAAGDIEKLDEINSGYNYNIKSLDEKMSLIEISGIDDDTVMKIKQLLEYADKNIVAFYSGKKFLDSTYIGTLASFFNVLRRKGKKLVYWNKEKSKEIENLFEVSQLKILIPIFDDLDQAQTYLKSF